MTQFFFYVLLCYYPTSNGGMQNESPVETRTRRMHVFARLGPILHAQSVLSKQNFCIGAQEEVY